MLFRSDAPLPDLLDRAGDDQERPVHPLGHEVAERHPEGPGEAHGALLALGFRSLNPEEMVAEIKDRLREELDYTREADNQRLFAGFYRGHPFVNVPDVVDAFSTRRVLTTELVTGATFDEVTGWSQEERDMAGEAIFRFVFRSLYRFRAFNGDPHPGNYVFHGGGRVTFLDFGLVKHFSDSEMHTFIAMVRTAAYEHDPHAFRGVLEEAGMLRTDCPSDDIEVGEYFKIGRAHV